MEVRVLSYPQAGMWRNWYTRMLQEHMRVISWRFKSSHAHMNKLTIDKNSLGIRIDKFLKKEFFTNEEITRGEIIRQIKNGNVLVNGKKIKPSYILRESDGIEINILEKSAKILPDENIKFEIIHKNKDFIVINKPAGLLVHPSEKKERHTLISGLIYKFPKVREVGDEPDMRPGIVHRLDKDTSGIMVIAINQKTFLELKNKFKNREIKKVYWAIVLGKFGKTEKTGMIDKPLAKAVNYKKQVVAKEGTKTKIRTAITEYAVVKEMGNYSLVEAKPKTGRTHQIRVHMAYIGHPIIGDKIYKAKRIAEDGSKRQLLHAKSLEFELFEKKYFFEAKLPADFQQFLTNAA